MEGVFETQQRVEVEWRDPRVEFYNLQPMEFQNNLGEEAAMVWVPSLTLINTGQQETSTRDNSSLVTVARRGRMRRSGLEEPKNIFIYSGRENWLRMSRVHSTKWLCTFQMAWYPFDTQVCTLEFAPTANLGNYLELGAGRHTYSGDKELTQYFIRWEAGGHGFLRGTSMQMDKDNTTLVVKVTEVTMVLMFRW